MTPLERLAALVAGTKTEPDWEVTGPWIREGAGSYRRADKNEYPPGKYAIEADTFGMVAPADESVASITLPNARLIVLLRNTLPAWQALAAAVVVRVFETDATWLCLICKQGWEEGASETHHHRCSRAALDRALTEALGDEHK